MKINLQNTPSYGIDNLKNNKNRQTAIAPSKADSVSFGAKAPKLPETTLEKLKQLLIKLNEKTLFIQRGKSEYSSSICMSVMAKEKGKEIGGLLSNNSLIVKPVDRKELLFIGEADLLLLKKNSDMEKIRLKVKKSTGDITEFNKPFFTTWKSAFKQIDNLVDGLLAEFNNKLRTNHLFVNKSGRL